LQTGCSIIGRLEKVPTLLDGIAEAGRYYTGRLYAIKLPGGVYFYKLQRLDRGDVKKLMVLR
jgi:hypothetical protein